MGKRLTTDKERELASLERTISALGKSVKAGTSEQVKVRYQQKLGDYISKVAGFESSGRTISITQRSRVENYQRILRGGVKREIVLYKPWTWFRR